MFTFIAAAVVLASVAVASAILDNEEKSDPSVNRKADSPKKDTEPANPRKKVPVSTFGIEAYGACAGKGGCAA